MNATQTFSKYQKDIILNVYRNRRYDEILCTGTYRTSYFENIKRIFPHETYAIDSAIYAGIDRLRLNAQMNPIFEESKHENRSESNFSIEVLREMYEMFKTVDDELKRIRLLSFITKIEDNYSHKPHSAGGYARLSSHIHIQLSTEDIQLLSEILNSLLE
jgi:hypothetical protein